MSLREHLQKIYDKQGKLTPQIVLDEARRKNHPLHDRFPWDDHEAAELHRLSVAHDLIVSVRVVFRSTKGSPFEKSLRGFHAIRQPEGDNGGYVYEPLDKIVADPILSEIVMRDMEREWKTLRRRYEDFSEFWAMVKKDVAA